MSPCITQLPVLPQLQVTLNCNLACTYCFQDHHGPILSLDTAEAILTKVLRHNLKTGLYSPKNRMVITWHGGEPLLAGLDFYRQIVEMERQFTGIRFENRLQTNGTLMTEEMAYFFADNDFNIGFSLDGPEKLHNLNRKFSISGGGSFDQTMRGIELYRQATGIKQTPVIAVVTPNTMEHVDEFFNFFKTLRARVQLDIYDLRWKDFDREQAKTNSSLPSSEQTGRFLIQLFDRWFYDSERQVDFPDLRDEVKMILQPELDKGDPFQKKRCHLGRLIFDPAGLVFSCDQYINDEQTSLGDITRDSLTSILERKVELWEQIKNEIRHDSTQMACMECNWGHQCSGGCITCLKYNVLLQATRNQGLPDEHWPEAELHPELKKIQGEFYYCQGLRIFRTHVHKVVQRELASGE